MVVMFDLGKEFDSIYATWDKLTDILDKNNIEYSVVKADYDYYFDQKSVNCKNGTVKNGYSWCGGMCRWGTTLKVKAIQDFYKSKYPDEQIVEYVGIASDELDRVQIKRNQFKIYPLIYWGMTENDCLVKCYKAGFEWKEDEVSLYQVLDRVSCFCCGNKNLKELKAMYERLPKYWNKLKQLQERTNIPYKQGKTVKDLEIKFNLENNKD